MRWRLPHMPHDCPHEAPTKTLAKKYGAQEETQKTEGEKSPVNDFIRGQRKQWRYGDRVFTQLVKNTYDTSKLCDHSATGANAAISIDGWLHACNLLGNVIDSTPCKSFDFRIVPGSHLL